MSRSADWQLRLDGEAWTLRTADGIQRQVLAATPEAALAQIEGRAVGDKRGLSVILGDAWLRYLVLTWPPGMQRSDERRNFMAHRFQRVHEIAEPDWLWTMDRAVADYPALACAVPVPLLNAVRDFAEVRNLSLASVTGDFPATFNACRRRFDEPAGSLGALALLRGSRLTVGLWRDGAWLAVRSQNVGGPAAELLPVLLESWRVEFAAAGGAGDSGVFYAAGPVLNDSPAWRRVVLEAP